MATVLVVDDDPHLATTLGAFYERAGHQVLREREGEPAIETFLRVHPDLVLLDLRLPDISGFEVLARIRDEEPVVIMITGHGDVPLAVRALQGGADNFLVKPVDLAHLAAASDRALETARLRHYARHVRDRRVGTRAGALLGTSPAMRELEHQIELLASAERTPVLLVGESGTGKGRLAGIIHEMSPRALRPFVELNCRSMAPASIEAELFGGASSADAAEDARRVGLTRVADGGTLFLDEIAALPLAVQLRVVRLLEGGDARDGRAPQEPALGVRVIAATRRDLAAEVEAGRFREDLYYALSVMPVALPPLRARAREDLVALIARAVEELRAQLPGAPTRIAERALERLLRHSWPGNLRELRNTIERAMIVGRGALQIAPEHLPTEVRTATGAGVLRHIPRSLAEVERAHIERTLRAHRANRTHAARELGISRATLINKIRQYHLDERERLSRWGARDG